MGVFSFQGTDAERTIFWWHGRARRSNWRRGHRGRLRVRGPGGRGLVRSDTVEERGRRDEKKASSNGCAEVKDAIVVAGRSSDEHIFKHVLDGARRTAVADKVGAELTVAGAAERHVVPQNFDFFSVLFDDG